MEFNNEEKLEKAMKISKTAGVTLEEAKMALEGCNYDLLDAMVYLEKLGKTSGPAYSSYTTTSDYEKQQELPMEQIREKKVTFSEVMNKIFKWCGKVIKMGNENSLIVEKNDKDVISMPITVGVLFLVFCFWFFVPVLIVGLVVGCRYRFAGPAFSKDDAINKAMDKASEATEELKKEIKESVK